MMLVTKTHLSRRTVLRGAGTALALPLLDAMIPALRADRQTAAAPVRRLGFIIYAGSRPGPVEAKRARHGIPVERGSGAPGSAPQQICSDERPFVGPRPQQARVPRPCISFVHDRRRAH